MSVKIGKRGKFQILLVVLWLLLVVLLSSEKLTFADRSVESVAQVSGDVQVEQTNTKAETPRIDPNMIDLLTDGKLAGIPFGLGTSKQVIVSKWGTPDQIQNLTTHELLYYAKHGCFFSVEASNGQVIAIGSYQSSLDVTPAELKEIAGTPFSEGEDAMDGGWLTMYRAGKNEVYFNSSDKNSPITSWLLKGQ